MSFNRNSCGSPHFKTVKQVCLEELHLHQLSDGQNPKLKSTEENIFFCTKCLCRGNTQVRTLDLMLFKGVSLAIQFPLSSCFSATTAWGEGLRESTTKTEQIACKYAINSPHRVLWNNIQADKCNRPQRLTLAVTYCAPESSKCVVVANAVHRGLNLAACRRGSAGERKTAPRAGPFRSIPKSESRLLDKGKNDVAHPH